MSVKTDKLMRFKPRYKQLTKEPPSSEKQALMAKAVGQRNEIECSFGIGKRVYQANDKRAKLPETAECWTGMCYFAKNVMKFFRELCHTLYDLLRFFNLGGLLEGRDETSPSDGRQLISEH